MGKIIAIAVVMMMTAMTASGQTATGYEWWFDDDVSSVQSGEISSGQFTITHDLSDLPQGIHFFNLRLSDAEGVWGAPYRRMVLTSASQTGAVAYEYWIDGNYESKKEGALTEGVNAYTVSLEGVRKGLHRFNYRMRTSDDSWGSVYSQLFFYASGKSPFTNYEYWLDNDYANKVTGTAASNPVSFNVNLNNLDKKGAHFFNLRTRDDDGEWSSVYRKLILFYKDEQLAPILGYRHSLNGSDLGYVAMETSPSENIMFTVDLPENAGVNIEDVIITFNGDELSFESKSEVDYTVQIESELGWSPPVSYSFEIDNSFSTLAQAVTIPSSLNFAAPSIGEFKAVKFDTDGSPFKIRTNRASTLDIYKDSVKMMSVSGEELLATKTLELEEGTYYGVVYDVAGGEGDITLELISSIQGKVENPQIRFENLTVVIVPDSGEGVRTYYTLDGSEPTEESEEYTSPFTLSGDAIVRARSYRQDYEPSDITDYNHEQAVYVVLPPSIRQDENIITLYAQTDGSQLYYSIDDNNPESMTLYSAPFEITGNCIVYAQARKEGMYSSTIEQYNVDYNPIKGKVGNPQIRFENLTVVIVSDSGEGVRTYYTLDGSEPTEESQEYTSPFTLSGDAIVRARSYREDYEPSEISDYNHEQAAYVVLPPSIRRDGNMIYLEAQTEGSVLYYAIGDINTDAMTAYSGPFEMNVNGTVYAQARKDGMYDSEVVSFIVSDNQCPPVAVEYDGRYVTLTCEDGEAMIHYTLNGDNPSSGQRYSGTFDVGNICILKAYATKDGFDDSNVTEYSVDVYADENHAVARIEGVLQNGFGWDTTLPSEVDAYRIEGSLNASDIAFIRTMQSLRHLDIKDAAIARMPSQAFSNMRLVSISLPTLMDSYDEGIFNGCSQLSAIVWNNAASVDNRLTEGIDNPNLLLYLNADASVDVDAISLRNVVRGNSSEIIVLSDAYPFYAPGEFNANEIVYTRNFSKQTEVDGGIAGWETLTVPFDVQSVKDANGEVYPFAAETGERKFWLYRPVGTGWERTAAIEAYMPYLIAMPNHPWYEEAKIIRGNVEFRAENALVPATPDITGTSYNNGFVMMANYLPVEAAADVYVVNDEAVGDFQPGGVFVAGVRDARPFECYLTGTSSARHIPIFDTSEVETLLGDTGIRIWSENKDICIFSGIDARIRVYDIVGQLVRIADVKAGEIHRISGLNKGIYLVGDKKMYVK